MKKENAVKKVEEVIEVGISSEVALKLTKENLKAVEKMLKNLKKIEAEFENNDAYYGYESRKDMIDRLEITRALLIHDLSAWKITAEMDAAVIAEFEAEENNPVVNL